MARPSNTDERREQIAEALLVVMARHGYEGASVAAVARQAGVATGLVHYHFQDKREILLVALERLARRQSERVEARLAGAGPSPRAQLDAWLRAHLEVGAGDPVGLACWVMAGGEALRDHVVQRAHAGVMAASLEGLTGIVTRGLAEGEFAVREGPAGGRAAAVAIGALVQGYFVLAAVAPGVTPAGSALEAARQMADGLLGGREEPGRAPKAKSTRGAKS